MNPAKLVFRELPVRPFTFSFNRLIAISARAASCRFGKKLVSLLTSIQVCTRCGKCNGSAHSVLR